MRLGQAAAAIAALSLTAPTPASAQVGKALSSIFGCEASGNKQAVGAVIGGVVGGAVGNRVADDNRTLGTAVGAALGAAAGAYLGCRMQKSDQQKAEAAAREALDKNHSTAWNNPETGASGDITMVSTQPGAPVSMSGWRLANGVELASGYEAASGRYQGRGVTNLRAQPNTSSAIVGKLRKGDGFDSMGRAAGTRWLLAGRNGVGVGYVAENLVSPLGAPTQTAGVCRTFDQTVRTAAGAPETQRYTACKNAAGEWVVQA